MGWGRGFCLLISCYRAQHINAAFQCDILNHTIQNKMWGIVVSLSWGKVMVHVIVLFKCKILLCIGATGFYLQPYLVPSDFCLFLQLKQNCLLITTKMMVTAPKELNNIDCLHRWVYYMKINLRYCLSCKNKFVKINCLIL